ncbi:nucleic acid-binding, OB-fold protein [Tanacetum coccineum]
MRQKQNFRSQGYRRWIAQNVPTPTLIGYCCILLDRQVNAIQANMIVSDIEHSSQILETGLAYKIYYIGCVRSVGDLVITGDPNKRKSVRRKVDIENLNGYITKFMMWDDMVREFDRTLVEKMEAPVIIVVSSCQVSRCRDLQLSASPSMHYYFNMDILEVE